MVTRNRNLDKRVNWFDRQFVRAQDFVDADDYDLDRRRRHVRLLHTPGVAEGLQVSGMKDDTSVTVGAGTAVDTQGREIVALTPLPPASLPSVSGTVEVYLVYDEVLEDASTDPGVEGFTRIHELPSVAFRDLSADDPVPQSSASPPVPGILLARVALTDGKLTDVPDNGVRVTAGAVIGTATLDGVSLRRADHPVSEYSRITAEADSGDVLVFLGSPPQERLRVSGTGTTVDGLSIRPLDHSGGEHPRIAADAPSGDLLLLTGDPATERVRIAATGAAGIGTTTPLPGALTLEHPTAPLFLRQAGGPVSGGAWRASVGGSTLRFDANTAAAGDFSSALAVLALSTTGDVSGFGAGGAVTLGPGGNIPLVTRHIYGKLPGQDGPDTLYLNYGNGKSVEVGREGSLSSLVVHGEVTARNFPSNDSTQALSSFALTSRAAGGAEVTWKLYTAAVGGGFGVFPGAYEIWHYKSGTTDPRFAIHENGDTFLTPGGGQLFVSGQAFNASDARLKQDVEPVTDVLRRVALLRGVTYRPVRSPDADRALGVIAQDVERVFPELVTVSERDGYRAVDYGGLTAVLVEAVKELAAQVQRLTNRQEEDA